MTEQFIKRLNALYQMDEMMADKVRSYTKIAEYKSGDFILREGQVCNKVCMVAEGLVRSYYLNDGKDITSRFMEEEAIITSWPSYYTQLPGNEFMEATEDTILLCLNYTDIQKLYAEIPEFNIVGRRQVEYAFFLSEQRTQMLRKNTAEEKYKFFLKNHPSLLQRVALKHIATYLGMNEETLSRIRSRFHKNNPW